VLVPEQRLSPVQRPDIASYTRIALFNQTQRVPQRFHFLTPAVESCGSLFFLCTLHLRTTTLMRRSNATFQGARARMIGLPTFCISTNRSKFAVHGFPRLLPLDGLACGTFSGGQ